MAQSACSHAEGLRRTRRGAHRGAFFLRGSCGDAKLSASFSPLARSVTIDDLPAGAGNGRVMATDFSSGGFLAFLREAAVTGQMHPAVARSRRKAAESLFEYLSEDERGDLRELDVQALTRRVHDARDGVLRSEVIDLYAARLQDALDDYLQFSAAEASGEVPPSPDSGRGRRSPARRETGRASGHGRAGSVRQDSALESIRLSFDRHRANVMPIPLDKGRVVYLHDLPADLTPAEARKIARVLEALASDADGKE